jgi:ActR/RegA family two-component response regulator
MNTRLTALVVEKDARSRFVLRTALAQRGFRVLAARSRAEALDLVSGVGSTPDVMLLDDPATDGAYRVIGFPNAGAEELEVRLLGWRTAASVPARVSDILSAVEELSRPAATG